MARPNARQRAARLRARQEAEFKRLERLALAWDPAYNKCRVTIHETGHCFLLWNQRAAGVLESTTVVPAETTDGLTRSEWPWQLTRAQLTAMLRVQLGGRCAEEIAFGGVSMGHGTPEAGDEHKWRRTARAVNI
uniref:Peptidase M41 domain-containing protein n=1 Tax=Globodera rostochiensis TaxID=31243 RepID=A0A914HU36_GLORO